MFKYWVQEKAKAGNWLDCFGFQEDDYQSAMNMLHYERSKGQGEFRLVIREDREIA